ncbi:unnamed protein product [Rhizophagus irregularis]|nr:unnamed protein product [Rhizophagus irregularis]
MSPILPEKVKRSKSGTKYLPAVDLHERRYKEARNIVINTIQESHATGISRIRFITGRGNHVNQNGEQGVLYKAFRSWLSDTTIKHLVQSYIKYDGSYVVFLKISKESNSMDSYFDVSVIKQEALNGDIDAQFILGLMYLDGNGGVKQDAAEALKWLRKCAEKGDISAQLIIGNLLQEGTVVDKNVKEAFKC